MKHEIKIGQRFGRLITLENQIMINGYSFINCACDCGEKKPIRRDRLINGSTKSCGCLHRETILKNISKTITHGHSTRAGKIGQYRSKTYITWMAMKFRCLNKNHKHYKDYGGRGILICDRWLKFESFLADMGERPEGLTLDRINVNGNYEPFNCRWATKSQQINNRRCSHV